MYIKLVKENLDEDEARDLTLMGLINDKYKAYQVDKNQNITILIDEMPCRFTKYEYKIVQK